MRPAIIPILLFFTLGIYNSSCAQVTVAMQAKVNIVSGATYSSVEETPIDFSSIDASLGEFQTGSFTLKVAPGADVKVYIREKPADTNNQSEKLEFDSISVEQSSFSTGLHNIYLIGKVNNSQKLSGFYRGSVTAIIEYL